jgi:hypothetical protein
VRRSQPAYCSRYVVPARLAYRDTGHQLHSIVGKRSSKCSRHAASLQKVHRATLMAHRETKEGARPSRPSLSRQRQRLIGCFTLKFFFSVFFLLGCDDVAIDPVKVHTFSPRN